MPRKLSPTLTEAEIPIMEALWHRGEARVSDLVAALDQSPKPAYTTVLTMLRILEKKGCVGHTKDGRAHVFYPLIDRGDAQRDAVRFVLDRFFDNSPGLLVQNLVEETDLKAADLARLKKMIQQAEDDHA